jgi:hypothetical protein
MKSSVKISIAKPCAENWEEMLPAEQGRHCAACERLIIDFSVKTDQEILEYIKQSNGKLCGRFSNNQLDRDLIQESNTRKISLWEKVAASLLFFISVDKANASDLSIAPKNLSYIETRTDTDKNIHREKEVEKKDTLIFRGTVIDEKTNEAIPFAAVIIHPYNRVCQTDFDGKFELIIPAHQKSVVLTIKCIGFYDKTTNVKLDNRNLIVKNAEVSDKIAVKFALKSHLPTMGEVVVYRYKWYKFWKNF